MTFERALQVETITTEADGVVSLVLTDPDGYDLPAWEPGAHIDVIIPDGRTRQYSLCGDVDDHSRYRIGILREPKSRGGSEFMHTGVKVGDRLTVRGPRNNFILEDAYHHVFIAGGIGVTPILPMVAKTAQRRGSWRMIYGGRALDAMAFRNELPDGIEIVPHDECGHPDLDAVLSNLPNGTLVYCCGPSGLIEAVRARCSDWADPDAVRFELFSTPEDHPDTEDQRPFEVELAYTGTSFVVQPDESILEHAISAGADSSFDCQDGICGSCETPILEGQANHRDHVLTAKEQAENTCLMICVSRSAGPRLVLDL